MEKEKKNFDTYLAVLMTKEFKKEVQKIALDRDESVSEVVRNYLESYIKKHSNASQEDKPKKVLKMKKSI